MQKLKASASSYSRWSYIETKCTKLEYLLANDFSDAVEFSKSIIESICKTILEENKIEIMPTETVHSLMSKTISIFRIETHNETLKKVAKAFITIANGMSEIRNLISNISHGMTRSEEEKNRIDDITSTFLINCVESLSCFLIEYYEIEFPKKELEQGLAYEQEEEFNNFIDDQYERVTIAESSYLTSEALYYIDPVIYKSKYNEFKNLEVVNDTNRI